MTHPGHRPPAAASHECSPGAVAEQRRHPTLSLGQYRECGIRGRERGLPGVPRTRTKPLASNEERSANLRPGARAVALRQKNLKLNTPLSPFFSAQLEVRVCDRAGPSSMRERRADAERRAGRFIVLAPLSMLKHSRPVSPERLPRVREDVAAGRRARSLSPLRMCRSMPDMSSMSTFPAERMRHSFHASASNSFSSADAVEQSLTHGLPGAPRPRLARALYSQPCRSQQRVACWRWPARQRSGSLLR